MRRFENLSKHVRLFAHHGVSQARYSRSIRGVEICALSYAREASRLVQWQCSVEPLPPRQKKRKYEPDKDCLSPRSRPRAHTKGLPCRECWWQVGRARPLARYAPGACHQRETPRPYPLLAVQGATVFRAGLLRRGASFTVACLPFSPPSLPTYCHPRFYASPGPRWRRSERRKSELSEGRSPERV